MTSTELSLRGVIVSFPFEPYEVQENYMAKVIECLQNGTNALLESPTGTGKTLSLLCSSLGWLEAKKALMQASALNSNNQESTIWGFLKGATGTKGASTWDSVRGTPRIIYSSRTHSQLSQVINELKRTKYNYTSSVVLGSRDQMCLNPEVSKLQSNAAKQHMCRAKVGSKTCSYYYNYENKLSSERDYVERKVLDIEDLVTLGKKHTCCPYYASRHLKKQADVIFTPYNYLIDPKTRKSHGIELEGNVVIFDEAHNIMGQCEDSMSIQLRSTDLAMCINEVTQVMNELQSNETLKSFTQEMTSAPDFTNDDLAILKVMFTHLEEELDKTMAIAQATKVFTMPGSFLYEMLSKVELNPSKVEVVVSLLDKLIQYLTTINTNPWASKGTGLQHFSDLLVTMFSKSTGNLQAKKEFTSKFKVYLDTEFDKSRQTSSDPWTVSKSSKKGWAINCWCLSADIGMKDLMNQGVMSLILTSGTLSPLESFAEELGISFPVRLENPHIIDDKQVLIGIIKNGPDGTPLCSNFQSRSDPKYLNSLGQTIINFSRHIPDGMLAFFPSYAMLKGCTEHWERTGIWQKFSNQKHVFTEPQGKDAFKQCLDQYNEKIHTPGSKGASLFAVCRGKVSEGLDFSDRNARGVVITGLPFAPIKDPRVKLKMSFLDENKSKGLSGSDWYLQMAVRAVNQAIGRVIRHKNDFGAILLCDKRFSEERIQKQLSLWVRGRIKTYASFGPVFKDLSQFFRNIMADEFAIKREQMIAAEPSQASMGAFQFSEGSRTLKKLRNEQANVEEDEDSQHREYIKENILGSAPSTSNKRKQHQSVFDALDDYKASPKASFTGSRIDAPISNSANFFFSKNKTNVQNNNKRPRLEKLNATNVSSIKEEKPIVACNSVITKSTYVRVELCNGNRKIIRSEDIKPSSSQDQADDLRILQGSKAENSKGNDAELVKQMWIKRLSDIKDLLAPHQKYDQFCDLIKFYKENKDIHFMAEATVQLSSDIPNKELLVECISLIVNKAQKDQFLLLCKQMSSQLQS